MHQIRKHFAHILHPIIADRPHGCNKQNKLFKEKWQMDTMMLHAHRMAFMHPLSNEVINVQASLQAEFLRTLNFLQFNALEHVESDSHKNIPTG
jgi:tRNA pseudouridine65 synthase